MSIEITKENLLEYVLAFLPYPDQMKALDMSSRPGAITFTWRGTRYLLSTSLHVSILRDIFETGDNSSMLMGVLLKRIHVARIEAGL